MEKNEKIKRVVEALLVAFDSGLSREELQSAVKDVDMRDIDEAITSLREEYSGDNRSFDLKEVAGKVFIATKPEYGPWIRNLYQKEPERLSGPSLETLAIIAYRQPATRAEIEVIRGVNVGGVIKTLLEKDLIQIRGRKDVVGKPLLYGTTNKFLELFGLNSLNDLPELRTFSEEDLEYAKPQEHVVVDANQTSEEVQEESGDNIGEDSNSNQHLNEEEFKEDEVEESESDQEPDR